MADEPSRLSDRDLLVEIHTNVKGLKQATDDHEMRLRRIEKILYVGIGLSAGVGSAVGTALSKFVA